MTLKIFDGFAEFGEKLFAEKKVVDDPTLSELLERELKSVEVLQQARKDAYQLWRAGVMPLSEAISKDRELRKEIERLTGLKSKPLEVDDNEVDPEAARRRATAYHLAQQQAAYEAELERQPQFVPSSFDIDRVPTYTVRPSIKPTPRTVISVPSLHAASVVREEETIFEGKPVYVRYPENVRTVIKPVEKIVHRREFILHPDQYGDPDFISFLLRAYPNCKIVELSSLKTERETIWNEIIGDLQRCPSCEQTTCICDPTPIPF